MASRWWLEHTLAVLLVYAVLRISWQQHRHPAQKRKKKGKRCRWQPKSPKDCLACQEEVKLSFFGFSSV
jgi:hypothetical protein